ncbi:MAG: fused MFS/spermidine synthase [bacterium]
MKFSEKNIPSASCLPLYFLSGAAGMIYELVWLRMFAPVVGVEIFALGIVLAVYMGGLGIGAYYWGGRIDRSSRPPLAFYGWLEIGAALGALLVPVFLSGFDWLYQWFFQQIQPGFSVGLLFRLVSCILVLGFPCFLLGGTLPALSRHMVTKAETAGAKVGWLYGMNLAGAVSGTLLCGFYLIENQGVRGAYDWAMMTGLSIGLAALVLSRFFSLPVRLPVEARPRNQSGIATELLTLIGLAGFTGMAYEIIWGRILSLIMRNTVYAYSVMLVTFLTGLFLGDILVSRRMERIHRPYLWLGISQSFTGLYLLFLIPYYYKLDRLSFFLRTGGLLSGGFWAGYLSGRFLLCGLVMLLPAVLTGMAFPLIVKLAFAGTEEKPGTGGIVGKVYLLDSLGMVLASLIIPLVMIPAAGTQTSLFFAVALNLLVAVFCLSRVRDLSVNIRRGILTGLAGGYLVFGYLGRVDLTFREKAAFAGEEIIFYREDYQGLAEVYRQKKTGVLKLVSNRQQQEGDSSLSSVYNQRQQFYLPLLLHPKPEKILAIGLGTGISFGACAYLMNAEAVCLELSPAIAEASKMFTGRLPPPPHKLKVVTADGRNYLKRTADRYDLVFADLFTPYRSGVGNLYSLEHYREVRKHLKKSGLVCQLLLAHQMPPECVDIIMNTFKAVFPEAVLFMTRWNLALISYRDKPFAVDLPAFLKRFRDRNPDLNRYGLNDPYQFLSGFVAPLSELVPPGAGINSDNHPLIEFLTPRYLFNKPDGPLYYENISRLMGRRRKLTGRIIGATPSQSGILDEYYSLRGKSMEAKLANYQGNYLKALGLYKRVFGRNKSDADAAEFLAGYYRNNAAQLEKSGLYEEARSARGKARQALPWNRALLSR